MSKNRLWPATTRHGKLRLRFSRLLPDDEAALHPIRYPLRILRRREVLARVGFSSMTLWRKERAGSFPRRVRLGPNSVGYYEHEVDKWIRRRADDRDLPDGDWSPETE